jgi:hypothetical protein
LRRQLPTVQVIELLSFTVDLLAGIFCGARRDVPLREA